MQDLYIYAYPAQMLVFQIVTSDGKIMTNENCAYNDIIQLTARYLSEEDINTIYIVGNTNYTDKVYNMVNNYFGQENLVERVMNND